MEGARVAIFLKEPRGRLLATATVSLETVYFGNVTIKGFSIWVSRNLNDRLQEGINITPPGKQLMGKWKNWIFFETKECWGELERLIYSKYLEVVHNQNEEANINSKAINNSD